MGKDLRNHKKQKNFFMMFLNSSCPKIAVENPRPLKVVGLPKETQRIQPWQFGEPYTKLTYLWLKGLPELVPTHDMKDIAVPWVNAGNFDHNHNRRKRVGVRKERDTKSRSKTFLGIAKAMAEQWGKINV